MYQYDSDVAECSGIDNDSRLVYKENLCLPSKISLTCEKRKRKSGKIVKAANPITAFPVKAINGMEALPQNSPCSILPKKMNILLGPLLLLPQFNIGHIGEYVFHLVNIVG